MNILKQYYNNYNIHYRMKIDALLLSFAKQIRVRSRTDFCNSMFILVKNVQINM